MVQYNSVSAFKRLLCSRSFTSFRRPPPMDARLVGTAKERLLPLTTKAAMLSCAERIRPHAPHCITMYNNLIQHGRGHASHATFYIPKDYPDSRVVVWEWTYSPTSQHVGVFCLEEEVEQLTEALAGAPFIDWRGCLILHHIPPYLVSLLKGLAEEQGAKTNSFSCDAFIYYPYLDTEPLRLGPGLRACWLGKAGLRRVLETTEYERDMPLEVMCGLAQSLPYLGVYQDAGVTQSTTVDVSSLGVAGEEEAPVAWSISGFLGDVAKGETMPEYRRRGLGSLLATAVARRQAGLLGFIPHGLVADDNFASRAMLMQKAGWRHTHEAFWLCCASHE